MARTVTAFPLAMPRRFSASGGNEPNRAMRGFADALEFGQQVVQTARIGVRFADVIVLLEAAQFTGIATRKA